MLLSVFAARNDEPHWSAVMAGETLCDPVLHGEYFYTLSSDQAINCIDYTGSFVWRRNIERTVKPFLTVSKSGLLFIADSAGTVQAVSGQGIYLWSLKLAEPALYAPYGTADGRVCILTRSALYCLSVKGQIKWRMPLSAPPVRQMCETGTASLLLVLANKEFLTVTLTGELLNTRALKKDITVLSTAPEGYIMGTGDGILTYYRSGTPDSAGQGDNADGRNGGFALWQTQEPVPLFIRSEGGELLCVYADGAVSVRSIATNTIRWTAKLGSRISLPLYCGKTGGEYSLACKGFGAIIDAKGTVKHEKKIPVTSFLPLITPGGTLIAIEDWVVNSWRLDTKVMQSRPQRQTPPVQYGIIKMREGAQPLPFFIPHGDTAVSLLTSIEEAIMQGTTGTQEASYALTLRIILENKQKAVYFPYDFTVYERALAAELLGRLESLEYRAILLEEAQKTSDPTLAVALIRAFGFIAADPDGRSVEAVQQLLRRCGVRALEPAYAACDTLTEIARYGDKDTAGAAVKALFAIAASAFPENIKQYARQKIKYIVE